MDRATYCMDAARRHERQLKGWRRTQKIALIIALNALRRDLFDELKGCWDLIGGDPSARRSSRESLARNASETH